MVQVNIDGVDMELPRGISVLEAARSAGRDIPTLCYDPRLEPYGGCRLCIVKIDGHGRPETSCNTRVSDGMKITTEDEELKDMRRNILELLLDEKGISPDKIDSRKEFYSYLKRYGLAETGVNIPDGDAAMRHYHREDNHPFITVDMSKCINCYRCVRICDEVQGQFVWRKWNRGSEIEILPYNAEDLLESNCVSCGACADTCPTGAIEDASVLHLGYPEEFTRSVCPYCGTGCEINIGTRNDRIVEILPVLDSPVNKGHLCIKGRYSYGFADAEDRITDPMIKDGGVWRKATWQEAYGKIACEFRSLIEKHGGDSIGILGSSRATNEENYLTQKFARIVLGTNNVDGCARVCHAPTAGGMGSTLGTGAATNSFNDIERADTFLVIGANPTENHPVVGARIKQRVLHGSKLIVVDPRKTELAKLATIHLQILPGTDVPLINAMAETIIEEGLMDQEFLDSRVDGFHQYREFLKTWSAEKAADICGVTAEEIKEAARLYATAKPAMMFHGLGVTEHIQGTQTVMDLVNLALITGNIGKPGSGVNPLRGQNNVQGSAHMGVEPSKLTGYVPIEKGRALFEDVWGARIPAQKGLDGMQMIDAALQGKLHALWVIGWDIHMTNPDRSVTDMALSKLGFIVIQDLFMNETAKMYGNVFLPVVSSYEKDGTFMNSERRIQRIRKAITPRGNSKADWQIISELAAMMGKSEYFQYTGPEDIWNEIRRVWEGGRGITYERISHAGLQWPCKDENDPGTEILHRDSFTIGLRASLTAVGFHPTPEETDEDYPILLTTGRSLFQFNASTMTGRSGNNALRPSDLLQISHQDAERLGISDGEVARIASRYGTTLIRCSVGDDVKQGVAFATFNSPLTQLNLVTGPNRDNLQNTPEYKVTAIRIEKIGQEAGNSHNTIQPLQTHPE